MPVPGRDPLGPGALRQGDVDRPTEVEVQQSQGAILARLDPPSVAQERHVTGVPPDNQPPSQGRNLLVIVDIPVALHTEVNHIDDEIPTPAPLRLPVVNGSSGIPIGNPIDIPGQLHTALLTPTPRPISDGILRGTQALTHR